MGRNWEDLLVWQKSHRLVIDIYKILSNFPEEEKYGLISQIKRCAISIPANIVEGHSKNTKKEFLRFLFISRGSLEELKYYFLLSKDLGFIEFNKFNELNLKLGEVSYLLNQLIKSLTSTNVKNINSPNKKESYNGKYS